MAYTDIDKPSDYFNTKLYTGNGSTNAITGVGFQPDFNWIKNRSNGGAHLLVDVIRGMNNIRTNTTDAEQANGAFHQQSLDADGFTVAGAGGNSNTNGDNYASWNWLADNTSGSSNTDGSITSTVSANTTSGFSILTRTGTGSNGTVGHGLGVPPKVIINKDINNGSSWWGVYHESLGNTNAIYLNNTNATDASVQYWNNTSPTSTVFSVGTNSISNASGGTYISYCFAEKKGFSKFGSYTGNGSTDGTFVYLGFKPAWVMLKRTGSAGGWVMFDNKRNSFNVMDETLLANVSDAETVYANQIFDFVSNGLKVRGTANSSNASGSNYLYMAFAENPFVTSTGIPACAR